METTKILYKKYFEIRSKLQHEQEKYRPIIHSLESQLENQMKEFHTLQNMLNDAINVILHIFTYKIILADYIYIYF